MNIDEKIKELEEKQLELSKEIEELKKYQLANNVRWRAKQNIEKYFYKDDMGIMVYKHDNYQHIDNYRYAIGNYYKTKEQTEIIEQNRLTYQQLKDIALRLNKGHVIDWNDENQNKYYICFDYIQGEFKFDYNVRWKNPTATYCLDENFLKVAFSEIGEERLKQLLEWGI